MRTDSLIFDVLCCPGCEGSLSLDAANVDPDGHVIEGTLSCERCTARFPIRRGVPRLVTSAPSDDVEETVDAFGWQWQQANKILKHPHFGAPEVFLDFIHPVQPEWFRGKVVLDGGAGLGRFTVLSAQFGARLVIGIDLSASVDVAFDNTRHLSNVVIVQADVLALPVRRAVEYAFSVGVLHHTADPRGAFLRMVSKVVPGGSASAWVYGRENNGWIIYGVNPLRRITSHLPRRLLLAGAYALAVPLTLVGNAVYRPVSRRPGLGWLRRRLFYFDYMAFLAQFDYRTRALIVFDHAVPVIAAYIPKYEFAEWFEAAGLTDVTITMRNANSWRGFGILQR